MERSDNEADQARRNTLTGERRRGRSLVRTPGAALAVRRAARCARGTGRVAPDPQHATSAGDARSYGPSARLHAGEGEVAELADADGQRREIDRARASDVGEHRPHPAD